jgi:hypothetical protein
MIHFQVTLVVTNIFPAKVTQLVYLWIAGQIGMNVEILGLNKQVVRITNFRIVLYQCSFYPVPASSKELIK